MAIVEEPVEITVGFGDESELFEFAPDVTIGVVKNVRLLWFGSCLSL
jgi:hypothetical protein